MNLLKKPFFAVLISAVLVIASTLISVNVKLSAECQKISDGFIDGIEHNGQYQKGIAYYLDDINSKVDEIADIAYGCGINTDDLMSKSEDLKLGLTYSAESASYLFYCYEELNEELDNISNQLSSQNLSSQNKAELETYYSDINDAQNSISQSAYNETVRQFIRENRDFPTAALAEMAGVYMPEYFA